MAKTADAGGGQTGIQTTQIIDGQPTPLVDAGNFGSVSFERPAQPRRSRNFLLFPVKGSRVGARFGQRGPRWRTSHSGIDLEVPEGSAVVNAVRGKVIAVSSAGALGNHIKVLGADGRTYTYAHLKSVNVRVGQAVGTGQTIGAAGRSGNATGPHLHFEVEENGRQIDPGRLLGLGSGQENFNSSYTAAPGTAGGFGGGAASLSLQTVGLPFDTDKYYRQAIQAYGDTPAGAEYYQYLVTHSAEFKAYYPGIMRSDGTFRMDPMEYDKFVNDAIHQAKNFGLNLTRAQVGQAIAGDQSIQEFGERIGFAAHVKANKQYFDSFNQILIQAGYKPIRSAQEALDFTRGRSNEAFYTLAEEASIVAGAKSAGIDVGLSRAFQISERTVGTLSPQEYEQGYKQIAERLRFAGPEIEGFLAGKGVDRQTALEILEFGGPNRTKLAADVEQALKQRQAQLSAPRVSQQLRLQGGRPTVGTTEEVGL